VVANVILNLTFGAAYPPAGALIIRNLCFLLLPRHRHTFCSYCQFYRVWCELAAVYVVITAVQQLWLTCLGGLASGGLALFFWWLSRRRRKRAPKAYGAKARALLAKLVRRAREAAPRRVLRRPMPVPG
jgi:hypothetical protein